MNARRRMGLFLVIGGVLLLGASGWFWRGDPAGRAAREQQHAALEDSSGRMKAAQSDLELKKRGFQNSLPEMPDTVQRYGGAKVMEILGGYTRRIYLLEMKQRDLMVDIKALEREMAGERKAARAKAVPAAAAGAVCLVMGVVLAAMPGRRVGA